jgi:hypothetical protein
VLKSMKILSGGNRQQLGDKTEANHRLVSDVKDRSRWHTSKGFEEGRHVMHACMRRRGTCESIRSVTRNLKAWKDNPRTQVSGE